MTLYSFTLFLWWFSNILSQVIHWLDLKKKKKCIEAPHCWLVVKEEAGERGLRSCLYTSGSKHHALHVTVFGKHLWYLVKTGLWVERVHIPLAWDRLG